MGYYFRTNLSCTNPKIIATGSTFNQKTYSEIIGTNGNEIHYITWKATMYKEVEDLSLQYPEEKFFITSWYDSDYYDRKRYTGVFINGDYEETKVEPVYTFFGPSEQIVDSTLKNEFVQKMSKFIDKAISQKDDTFSASHYLIPDNSQDKDGFKTYITFHWETEDHRFIAENKHGYMIEIQYESKDKENLERLRLDNQILREQINIKDDDNLPF